MEIEYFLLALLLILMYIKPAFLNGVHNNSIMKIIFILITIYVVYKYGKTAGILMACIFILLLNDNGDIQIYKSHQFEGFSPNMNDKNEKENKKEESNNSDKHENEDTISNFKANITDLSRDFELNTERNQYNYRYVDN